MKTRKIISLLLAVMMIVAVIPAGIISVSAAEEAVTFDSSSWTTSTGAYSVKVGDGTYLAAPIRLASYTGYDGTKVDMPWRFSATSTNKADLSKGFTLTFDAKLISEHGAAQAWGVYELYENFFRVDIGDTITFRFANCSDTFYLKVGSTEEVSKVMTSHGGSDVYKNTAANAAELNGSYIIQYDGSKVTVTINNVEILSAPVSDSAALAEDLAEASIGFSTLLNHENNGTSVDLGDVFDKNVDGNANGWAKVVQNIALTRTVDGEGEHICRYDWTNAVSNNDATCTQNGTEYAECTCGETRTREDDDSALGHEFENVEGETTNAACNTSGTQLQDCIRCDETTIVEVDDATGHSYVANEDGTTKTCSVCGKTIGINNAEFYTGSWVCAIDPDSEKSKEPMITVDGENFYYPAPRTSGSEIGSSDEGYIISKSVYDFADGFKFTFTANVCRAGKATWGTDAFSVAFGNGLILTVGADSGYVITANGTEYTYDLQMEWLDGNASRCAPANEDEANKLNTTYTIEYKNGKVTLTTDAGVIDFGEEITIDEGDFSKGKIRIHKGWTWTKVAKDTYDPADYATDFLIFSDVSFETIPAPVAPVYEGVQEGKVDDVFSVRFVATVKNLNYSEVGFKITAMDGAKSWTKGTNTVYSSLIGNTNTGVEIYDETNLHGQYIYALTIQGVPTTGTVVFNVTAYGIVDGVEVVGTTYAVTYTDGVYIDTVVA